MFKLLVILYIIKLYAQINIYKHIKKKHGQDVFRNVRLCEKLKTKYMKINADIKYIKSCRKEELTPHFAKVNLVLGGGMMVVRPHVCVCAASWNACIAACVVDTGHGACVAMCC